MYACMCAHVCVRVCVCACVCACLRACVHVCVVGGGGVHLIVFTSVSHISMHISGNMVIFLNNKYSMPCSDPFPDDVYIYEKLF